MGRRFLTWRSGFRKTGYEKMQIFSMGSPLFLDCYVFRIREGGGISPHKDAMRGKWSHKKHYRLNFVFPAKSGGFFSAEKKIFSFLNIYFFRADYIHQVSSVKKGTRYTLSFGVGI